MFSVYSPAGRLFRGSMEQLRRVGRVDAAVRIHSVDPIGQDNGPAAQAGAAHPVPIDQAHRVALAAYGQTVARERQPLSRVDDLMSRQLILARDSMSLLEAWQLLAAHGVGQAPVVNGHGVLVGLLARSELLARRELMNPEVQPAAWRAMLAGSVADFMWTPVPSVAPEADIRRATRVLLDTGYPGLPVADDAGVVTGFLSRADILRAIVTDPPLDLWG